jgi:hypothetical protein
MYGVVKLQLGALYHREGLLSRGQYRGDSWEMGVPFGIVWEIAGSDNGERANE